MDNTRQPTPETTPPAPELVGGSSWILIRVLAYGAVILAFILMLLPAKRSAREAAEKTASEKKSRFCWGKSAATSEAAGKKRLLVPLLDGSADVVFGSRFLGGGQKGALPFYLANRALSGLTNVLYGSRLTDIETCYKVFRREVLQSLTLRAARFEIEPEVTAQVLKRHFRVVELPIGYNPRSRAQGKKISWRDGFSAVYTLIDQRLKR